MSPKKKSKKGKRRRPKSKAEKRPTHLQNERAAQLVNLGNLLREMDKLLYNWTSGTKKIPDSLRNKICSELSIVRSLFESKRIIPRNEKTKESFKNIPKIIDKLKNSGYLSKEEFVKLVLILLFRYVRDKAVFFRSIGIDLSVAGSFRRKVVASFDELEKEIKEIRERMLLNQKMKDVNPMIRRIVYEVVEDFRRKGFVVNKEEAKKLAVNIQEKFFKKVARMIALNETKKLDRLKKTIREEAVKRINSIAKKKTEETPEPEESKKHKVSISQINTVFRKNTTKEVFNQFKRTPEHIKRKLYNHKEQFFRLFVSDQFALLVYLQNPKLDLKKLCKSYDKVNRLLKKLKI